MWAEIRGEMGMKQTEFAKYEKKKRKMAQNKIKVESQEIFEVDTEFQHWQSLLELAKDFVEKFPEMAVVATKHKAMTLEKRLAESSKNDVEMAKVDSSDDEFVAVEKKSLISG